MPTGLVCLSALRYISARAATILDRYSPDQAGEQRLWVPASMFGQFIHTLCWGNFADLDLHLLDSLDPTDRIALQEDLYFYHEYLRRQRERVDRFHRAYQDWLDECERELPREYLERLRHWRRRYGVLAYFRITGLATRSGIQQFAADPERHMATFKRAFAELAQQQAGFWQSGTNAGYFSGGQGNEQAGLSAQIEQALSVLGLSASASFTEVRRAYRRRAKMLHPDWQGEQQTAQMAALNAAYQLLCKHHDSAAAESRSH